MSKSNIGEVSEDVQHWADSTAERVIAFWGSLPQYVCASGITPSGVVHIGNFREIITVDLVARALRDAGKKVRFIYSWDDYDTFRKIPKDMPQQEMLAKHLRMPIVDVPDPFECQHQSYAHHHETRVEESLSTVGIQPEFISQSKQYRASVYAEQMKQALQASAIIKKILDKYRKELLPNSWLPVTLFCPKCGRDTTQVTKYDGKYSLSYTCDCGNQDTIDFRKSGIAKLLWRVDWPMRWNVEAVNFEPGGKDHSTVGGSFSTAQEIVRQVWNREPPVYQPYDFISIKGRGGKISSSKGDVVDLQDVLEIYEPAIVRYLFASTRSHAEFAISFDLDVLKIYEDFDKCERIYYGKEKVSAKEEKKQRRIYELSCVTLPAKAMPFQPSFRHLTNVLLMHGLNTDKVLQYYVAELHTAEDRERLRIRAQCAINWITRYAPEDFRYTLNSEVPKDISLTANERAALKEIPALLKKKRTDAELHQEFYQLAKKHDVPPQEFFAAAYRVLISKERGPKLAAFLLDIKSEAVALFGKL
ncbi:MAG TPA: lysine--tRNA ligase [Candidatus Nanoarchaeia archaeon]|nr:lysine--tRNA ligase [Candidatus Nanoarchaeia archaeon]